MSRRSSGYIWRCSDDEKRRESQGQDQVDGQEEQPEAAGTSADVPVRAPPDATREERLRGNVRPEGGAHLLDDGHHPEDDDGHGRHGGGHGHGRGDGERRYLLHLPGLRRRRHGVLFEHIEPIRADDEYANWRAHLRARYGKIDAPIKIDITAGDEIVPGRIEYSYPLMFEEGSVQILSYPIETMLAEKLETVVSRGIANTRGRDFYDIHTLLRLKSKDIDRRSLREAIAATTSKRGSAGRMSDYAAILEEVRESAIMQGIWASYVAGSPYAAGIDFKDVVDSALELARLAELDELE